MRDYVEQDLFEHLRDKYFPDLLKAPGIFDAFDCISLASKAYIELKCRYTHYPTLLIEEMKYQKLMTQSKARGLTPYYINSTPEGVFSFNLNDLPTPEWVVDKMPKTSQFSNRSKVDKLVGYLDITKAVQV